MPRWPDSARAATTCSAREGGRRGRSQASRATTEAGPVPVATTWPGGSAASSASVIARVSGATRLVSSGSSALRVLPASSRVPTRNGSRSVSSQARASSVQRSAAGSSHQVSKASVGVQAGLPSGSGQVARSPAAAATSTTSAVVGSSSWANSAAAFRSRTARAPLRRATGGCGAPVVDQQLHPAYRLERGARRGVVHLRGVSLGRRHLGRDVDPVARGVAAAQRDLHLARHAHETRPTRHQQPARQQLLGRARAPRPGVIARRADPASASPEPASTCSSIARAAGDSSGQQTARPPPASDPGVIGCSSESDPSASGTPVSGTQPRVALPDQGQVGQPANGALDSGRIGVEDVGQVRVGGRDPTPPGHQGRRARGA